MKILLILSFLLTTLFSNSQQILLVISKDFNNQTAILTRYEDTKQISEPIEVNIGQNGLGWGLSKFTNFKTNNEPIKKEGDKKSVAGIFQLSEIYTYHKNIDTKMPYHTVNKDYICIDDTKNKNYNKIVEIKDKSEYFSFEKMLLTNETYEYVIKVEHNSNGIKNAGSCIFIHVVNPIKKQTTGCTSISKDKLLEIIKWLDIKKNPILIQIPISKCNEIKKRYPFLHCEI